MQDYDGAKAKKFLQVFLQASLVSQPKVLILTKSSLQEEGWIGTQLMDLFHWHLPKEVQVWRG